MDTLIEGLPGHPDGVSLAPDGSFWVGHASCAADRDVEQIHVSNEHVVVWQLQRSQGGTLLTGTCQAQIKSPARLTRHSPVQVALVAPPSPILQALLPYKFLRVLVGHLSTLITLPRKRNGMVVKVSSAGSLSRSSCLRCVLGSLQCSW